MNPPIATTLALIEDSLHPLGVALKSIKSYNGHAVFVRDKHYHNLAATVAMYYPRVNAKRHEFARSDIQNHSIDLLSTAVGETFTTKQSTLIPSKMNRNHVVYGIYIALPAAHEAVLQIAFDKLFGALPSADIIDEAWQSCQDEITTSLGDLAVANPASIIEVCKLTTPTTPNAFVLKWDLMDSSHVARHDYGELRHFISTFEHTIEPLITQYGGHISGYDGDSQDIVVPLPDSIDRNDPRAVKAFAAHVIMPLINKIRIAHSTIAPEYTPLMRIRLGVGLGHIHTTTLGEETGPILWAISDKMKMRAGSSDIFTLCIDSSAKGYIK